MFTLDQIRAAHAKVKSGADFPAYTKEIKKMGVDSYEHHLSDGHITYHGNNDFMLAADAKWAVREVADHSSNEKFKEQLKHHQQGGSDYFTFCIQAAEAGVEKWVVDTQKMTCVYYDKKGNEMLKEMIPSV